MNDTSNQPPYGAAPPPPPPPFGGAQPSAAAGGPQPHHPQGDPGEPRPGLTRFFDAIRGIGLHRSQHRVVGGVCGGVAERTGIDPTVVRVLAVVLAIFGGIGVLLYGLAWLLLPEPDGRIHGEQVLHGKVDAGAIGAIVVTVLSLGGGPGSGWRHWGPGVGWHGGFFGLLWGLTGSAVVLAVLVFVVYLAVRGRGSGGAGGPGGFGGPGYGPTPTYPTYPASPAAPAAPSAPSAPSDPSDPPAAGAVNAAAGPSYGGTATLTPPTAPYPSTISGTSPYGFPTTPAPAGPAPTGSVAGPPTPGRRPSLGGFAPLVGGLALVAAGATVLIIRAGDYTVSTAAMAWAVALGVIAVALVIGGLLGRRSGVVTLFAIIALIGTLGAAVIPKAAHVQAIGERTWRPATTAPATGGYAVGIGHGVLDLSALEPAALDSSDPQTVPVSVGIGQLTIEVPPWLSVVVHTSVGAGSLPAPGADLGGTSSDNVSDGRSFAGQDDNGDLGGAGIKRTLTIGTGAPELIVNAKVGVGEIDIEQVSR